MQDTRINTTSTYEGIHASFSCLTGVCPCQTINAILMIEICCKSTLFFDTNKI